MSQAESNDRNRLLKHTAAKGIRLFINRVGKGWVGIVTARTANTITLQQPRPLEAGFGKGTSDLIGCTPITITPEMVGRTLAVYTAVEVKSEHGRATAEQLNYIKMVKQWGGIACVARSADDVFNAIEEFRSPLNT